MKRIIDMTANINIKKNGKLIMTMNMNMHMNANMKNEN